MIKSMTGYGKGASLAEGGSFTVEIRSVNHRYGEISIRMPRSFIAMENEIKKLLGSQLKRGKIDVYVQWEEQASVDAAAQVDMELARGYAQLFKGLAVETGLSADIPLSLVLAQQGVFCDKKGTVVDEELLPRLVDAVREALASIDVMRCREGEALAVDLAGRRKLIADWVSEISARAPQVVAEYQQKLKARLEQLLEGAEVDPSRLAQEVALLADRCDVTEELVRLASHFDQFDETLALDEPVGRKLDFLMQEMNREVNTIGSKSSDVTITSLVIRIKAEMEKMREQVQNIE